MTKLELETLAMLQEENRRLVAQNERLKEAVEGISQNPEYVQAAGWWGLFAASLGADRRRLRERVAELEEHCEMLFKKLEDKV